MFSYFVPSGIGNTPDADVGCCFLVGLATSRSLSYGIVYVLFVSRGGIF